MDNAPLFPTLIPLEISSLIQNNNIILLILSIPYNYTTLYPVPYTKYHTLVPVVQCVRSKLGKSREEAKQSKEEETNKHPYM
jgi:hypothetical protein